MANCGSSGYAIGFSNDNGGVHRWSGGTWQTSMVTIYRSKTQVITSAIANRDGFVIQATQNGNADRNSNGYTITPFVAGQDTFALAGQLRSYDYLIWTDAFELLP